MKNFLMLNNKFTKLIIIFIILISVIILTYLFRIELFGFNTCIPPNLIGINNIKTEKEGYENVITIEGDIISSALFYSDYRFKIEDGVLKIGLSYTIFKIFSTGKSNFSIVFKTKKEVKKIFLFDGKNELSIKN